MLSLCSIPNLWQTGKPMKSNKKKRGKETVKGNFFFFLLAASILILASLALYMLMLWNSQSSLYSIPSLSLENFTRMDVRVSAQNIILSDGCYRLSMATTLEQIQSIAMAIENMTPPRPNAHDLFVRSLNHFGTSVLFVKISLIINDAYYAKIFLKQGNNLLVLDSRPSDAIAIALRAGSQVYLSEDLLEGYAEKIC